MEQKQIENLKAELRGIGITDAKQLADAIKSLPPLNIYIMTASIAEAGKG